MLSLNTENTEIHRDNKICFNSGMYSLEKLIYLIKTIYYCELIIDSITSVSLCALCALVVKGNLIDLRQF